MRRPVCHQDRCFKTRKHYIIANRYELLVCMGVGCVIAENKCC